MQAVANNDSAASIMIGLYILIVVMFIKKINNVMFMISVGVGALVYAFEVPMAISVAVAVITLGVLIYYENKEGFQVKPETIVNTVNTSFPKAPIIEGYEDVKKEKDEVPAPADEKEEKQETNGFKDKNDTKESPLFQNKESEKLAKPFTLGEIPGQVKKGPHLDVSSTLMKAINSLDPEQVKAMSVDTKQLIETQKTLMGMLGNMKPMLQDGKELMNTFNDMFGK